MFSHSCSPCASQSVTETDGLTLTPMKRSLSTIQDSRNTKALLQQKSADTSVVLIFLRACRYR